MGSGTIVTIAYGLAAALANFLGGLLVSSRRLGQQTLRYLIALGAGFMLAAVFLKIIPESIAQWKGEALVPMLWLLGGYADTVGRAYCGAAFSLRRRDA